VGSWALHSDQAIAVPHVSQPHARSGTPADTTATTGLCCKPAEVVCQQRNTHLLADGDRVAERSAAGHGPRPRLSDLPDGRLPSGRSGRPWR
jgi:hypothetical protein